MLGIWIGLVAGLGGIVFGMVALWRSGSYGPWDQKARVNRVEADPVAVAAPAPAREIDTEWKKRRREEQRREWEQGFLDALGEDKDGLVREWAKDSPRLELARLLKADEAEARRRKDWRVTERVHRMRVVLTSHPEQPFSAAQMDLMRSERERWYWEWSASDAAETITEVSMDGTERVFNRRTLETTVFRPPAPPRGASGVSVPRRFPL